MANNLTAVIGADNTGLIKSVSQAKTLLEQYQKTAKGASTEIRNNCSVTDSQVASYQRVIKQLEKVNSGSLSTAQAEKALTAQIKELKIQWANLNDTAKSSDFGKSISASLKSAQTQLEQTKTQLKQVNKEMGDGKGKAKDLEGGLGDLVGKFGKFAAAAGVASAALKVAKDAMNSTETGADTMAASMMVAKSAYTTFLTSLSTGNWDNFFSNLSNAIEGADRLYQELDRLGSIKANNQLIIATTEQALKRAKLERDKLSKEGKDTSEIDKQITELTNKLAALKKQQIDQGKKTGREQIIQAIREQDGSISDANLEKLADEYIKHGQGAFDYYDKRLNELEAKGTQEAYYTDQFGTHSMGKKFDINNLSKQDQTLYKLYRAFHNAETKMQEGLQTITAAVNEETEQIQTEIKTNKWTATTAGGGSDGSKGKTTEVLPEDSLAGAKKKVKELEEQLDKLPFSTEEEKQKWREVNDELEKAKKNVKDIESYQQTERDIAEGKQLKSSVEGLTITGGAPDIDLSNIPINITLPEDPMETFMYQMQDATFYADQLCSTFGQMGAAIGQLSGNDTFGILAQSAAQAIPQVLTLVGAMSALAVANGVKSAKNWIEAIVAAAALTSTIISTIAAVKKSTKGYAEGGIIDGHSTVGDNNYARVNKGEMILNGTEQKRLFNMLHNGGYGASENINGGVVQFKIRGSELYGVLNNYNNKRNRI